MILGSRKHSKKRDAILGLIRATETHPGAQWVYDQLKPSIPDLSLGTVYRNIAIFKEEGLVESVGVVSGEERFDADTSPHPHAVCKKCGKVTDLSEEVQAELIRNFSVNIPGFSIDKRNTVFYGICMECNEETAALGR
ncbi:Fur family transcriptional regulator [Leadbettera azotonutricia]|uniref:Ferric uptake regulator, Fur family n=1 Tax=Leadbettera azotonutricia (strain ATCC BAA-888 / DSM 13862 / ZAS-9) TaxID=545695 RepID=F5YG43_LEAAZ|nr:transcriptional repressor [Leadbettera azotonutricia]AEF82867.1 ferric uptake regulator, Fur family [Leadbettera azotonutricia ZAS-9]